ncbi:hypothetical protein COO60DRAFT_84300 [Scenedesmus sp. NREL 46B-D3]|nr:hypothetical protein COO60DRAFT_84300 [Scenedesmus sp. NREL 46B-D3]
MLGARALSNILWSCAALGYSPPPEVLARVWTGSAQTLAEASPQALGNMLWAVASLELAPSSGWMAAWQQAALAGLQQQQWNCADVANAAWALGKFAGSVKLRHLLPPVPWRLALMRAAKAAVSGGAAAAAAGVLRPVRLWP